MEQAVPQEHHPCSDDVKQGPATRVAVTELGFNQISEDKFHFMSSVHHPI